MPRKKATPEVAAENFNLEEPQAAAAADAPKVTGFAGDSEAGQTSGTNGDSSGASSVTIKLREGKIDVESMREGTKKKLLDALNSTPSFFSVPEAAKPMPMPDWFFHVAYSLVGAIEAFAAQRAGFDVDIARAVFSYNPEEIKILRAPTEAVLKKYQIDTMKYKEEAALVMALVHVHMVKIQALQTLQQKRNEQTITVDQPQPAVN